MADTWDHLNEQVKVLDREIDAQAKKDLKLEKVYRSVPGFGRLTARTLANELGDMSQFEREDSLFCFLGLTPSEYSSGPNERKGHITRQGSALLRSLLVEAAWRAIRKDPELQEIYSRLKIQRGGKRAIVAVARRLVGRARACIKKKAMYELSHNHKAA